MKIPKPMMDAFQLGAEVIGPAMDEFVGQTASAAVTGAAKCLADLQSRIDNLSDDELLRETLRATVQLACGAISIVKQRLDDDDDMPTGKPN